MSEPVEAPKDVKPQESLQESVKTLSVSSTKVAETLDSKGKKQLLLCVHFDTGSDGRQVAGKH